MLARSVFAALLVAVLAAVSHRIFMQGVTAALSFPQDNFFGRIALETMHKFNAPGMYHALSLLDLKEGETLLEMCTGPGLGLEEALRYKGVTVIGVDLSRYMVQLASERNARAIEERRASVHTASVEDLSFLPSASVDKIFNMNCVYFWPQLHTALQELLRVLKPQGRMLTATKFAHAKLLQDDGSVFKNTNETLLLSALADAGSLPKP